MIVDPRGGQYTSMAVDKDGLIHIAYYDQSTQTLMYAAGNTSGFNQPVVLQSDVPLLDANQKETKYINMALDPNGSPWISFFDPTSMILKIFRPGVP